MIEITEAGVRAFVDGLISKPLILRALDNTGKSVGADVPIESDQWSVEGRKLTCTPIEVIADQAGTCSSYQVISVGDAVLVGYLDSNIDYIEADVLMINIELEFDGRRSAN